MTDPQDLPPAVRPGDVLAGKYHVERVLGAGGMGMVVAARHVQLDQNVAIKFLLPHMLANPEAVARFSREAKAAVRITNEHVARVFDVGTLETGAPYMVMEYLDGLDLGEFLGQRGPLPIDQAVEFVLQACVAVAEAHSVGIIHRDLKPANLFCIRRPDGQLSIKVLDFGISKVADAADPSGLSVTKTTQLMGSPLYMSPEQMHSTKSADAQSDIWALGVITYQLLTGNVPFSGEAITEVAVKVATQPPPPLRSARGDVPPALEAVILRCLEKDKRLRFQNVAELAFALAEFAPPRARGAIERIAGTIRAAGLPVSPMPTTQPSAALPWPNTIPPVGHTSPEVAPPPKRTGAMVAIAIVSVLVVGGAGAVVAQRWAAHRASASSSSASALSSASPLPSPAQSAGAAAPPAESTVTLAPPPAESAMPSASVAAEAPPAPSASAVHGPGTQPHAAGHGPFAWPAATAPGAAASSKPGKTQGAPPGCDPPFTFDDQGRKHFKPECYLNK
jgi:serine/threonine-protein kinase